VALVGRRAGGKGVNVARVLAGLGREVVVTGLAGGRVGDEARAELAVAGLADACVPIEDESRETFVVVESSGRVTGFSELGPEVSGAEWEWMVARFGELAEGAEAVVLSGSLPRGVPLDAYAQLMSLAACPVVLDAAGEPLLAGVAAGPAVVTINAEELSGAAGSSDVLDGAAALRREGAGAVVVSCGPEGLVAVTEKGVWAAAPPEPLSGNPTGAGDAASAAVVAGLVDGRDWPTVLADAAALSAAAVAAEQAGSFDEGLYRRLLDQVEVRELSARR
jgi:tagatose 6-phosphate kinase